MLKIKHKLSSLADGYNHLLPLQTLQQSRNSLNSQVPVSSPPTSQRQFMADSFRAARAAEQKAKGALEDAFSHLTSSSKSDSDSEEAAAPAQTTQQLLDEDFRIACGAYVKGRVKAGVRVKYNMEDATELLEQKADINSQDGDGWTSLHWASSEEHLPVVRMLLSSSPDLDVQDNEGCTALWVSAYNGIYQSAVLLLFSGASLTPRGKAHGKCAAPCGHLTQACKHTHTYKPKNMLSPLLYEWHTV